MPLENVRGPIPVRVVHGNDTVQERLEVRKQHPGAVGFANAPYLRADHVPVRFIRADHHFRKRCTGGFLVFALSLPDGTCG